MPPGCRAELIGGIVFMPSPMRRSHSRLHQAVNAWLLDYERATPGTEAHDNATTILGEASEPQPDAFLLIAVPGQGQTRVEDDYIHGPPELVVEVATSHESIDLHLKRADYEAAGVREYVVVLMRQQRLVWLVRRDRAFEELAPGPDGVLRSEVFPGLWLDPAALLRLDKQRLSEVLHQGLATPEHAAFVARLAAPGP
jgi:Uma2 family endonuclease